MRNEDSRAVVSGTPRTISYGTWLLAYGLFGVAVFSLLFFQRGKPIPEGGVIESLPGVVFMIGAVLAFGLVIALWRDGRRYRLWLGLAVISLFLAGEEASWGREPILGWTLFPTLEDWDLHSWMVSEIGPRIVFIDWSTKLGNAIALSTGILAAIVVVFGVLRSWRQKRLGIPAGFLFIAVAWALFAMAGDLTDLGRIHFYNRIGVYKWMAEEAAEIMAGVSIVFGVLSRGYQHRVDPDSG